MTSATLTTSAPAPVLPEIGELAGSAADRLVVIVAPSNGRFRPHKPGGVFASGELVGHVTGARDRADEVRCPVAATIDGLLALPGHLVTRGQALAWGRSGTDREGGRAE